jgi:uncharacterized protein YggE
MVRNQIAALLVGLTALAVVLTGAMAVTGAVGADAPDESSSNHQIAVDAMGEADAEPDKVVIEAAVRVEGDDPETIRSEVADGTASLRSALDSENVDYQTMSYRIRESHDERDAGGYVGIHAFEIVVDNPDNAGDIVSVATDAGAEIGSVEMTLSDAQREQLRDQAIENAMDDARHQAETVAAASDLTITGVGSVDASQERFSTFSYQTPGVEDSASGGAPTSIATGDVSVSYSVGVTFNATQ